MKYALEDTIVAPITSLSNQPIGIIRVSGKDSFEIVNSSLNKSIPKNRGFYLRNFYDRQEKIDEVLILYFEKNKSFTGEETIEINCHGNKKIINHIIEVIIKKGARFSENGEFSKRAFINGNISLLQAEGINNLIKAKNKNELKFGNLLIDKKNTKLINNFKAKILDVISKIQTSIDYPEYDDIEGSDPDTIRKELEVLLTEINEIIEVNNLVLRNTSEHSIVLYGKPNTGKSSIFNSLIREEKAIVSDIEGTTRDTIEKNIEYKDTSFILIDTAGIRESNDKIEKIGVEKAKNEYDKASLVLYVVDNLKDLKDLDLNSLKNKDYLIIFNKKDLLSKKEELQIQKQKNVLFYSTFDTSYKDLLEWINNHYSTQEILDKTSTFILSSYSDLSKMKQIKNIIKNSVMSLQNNQYLDIINIELNQILYLINQLIGYDNENEVIDNIFKKYCLGK